MPEVMETDFSQVVLFEKGLELRRDVVGRDKASKLIDADKLFPGGIILGTR